MKNKGFTLVEVLVAVAIFAIIIIPFGLSINQALKTSMKAKSQMDVSQVLNKAIEHLYESLRTSNFNYNVSTWDLPPYAGSDLKFGNDQYEARYKIRRLDCDYDIVMIADSLNLIKVYEKVYDSVYGGVKYDLAVSIPVTGAVYVDVYKETLSPVETALYKVGGHGVTIDLPRYKLYYAENGVISPVDIEINGVFQMHSGSLTNLKTGEILEVWSPNFGASTSAAVNNLQTISPTVKFISAATSRYYHQLLEVTIEIIETRTGRKLKEYKFIARG
ncbi:hypothetical protein Calkr_0825 [Caldicellulosiruptor acetigenus I77R1B]|uniref:Prepilin-type N-terminal cleavage/methylation domain-containing protein n=1 Tax=Caldicellulosiruptor acetigenus (strain ATCC 700853 / DSM 12137 / I77R1B) TaxID=632335 RepID=E4S4B1_CALA7|nr:prepilin-type N-terminal cleavage/methylation domain-containing protein [Caldicellulosiruptor acetigenus]ADQ40348.1 hypothetical protein Calkr_0825 [Caldicellulosiruptor acetigenus I77R1B]